MFSSLRKFAETIEKDLTDSVSPSKKKSSPGQSSSGQTSDDASSGATTPGGDLASDLADEPSPDRSVKTSKQASNVSNERGVTRGARRSSKSRSKESTSSQEENSVVETDWESLLNTPPGASLKKTGMGEPKTEAGANGHMEDLKAKLDAVTRERDELRSAASGPTETKSKELETRNEKLKAVALKLKRANAQQDEEIKALKAKLKEAEARSGNHAQNDSSNRVDDKATEKELQAKTQELDAKTQELDAKDNDLNEARKEIGDLRGKLAAADDTNEAKDRKIASLTEAYNIQQEQYEQLKADLDQHIENKTSLLEEVQSENEMLQSKVQVLSAELEQIKSKYDQETSQVEDLITTKERLEQEIAKVKGEMEQQLEAMETEYHDKSLSLQEEIETLRTQLDTSMRSTTPDEAARDRDLGSEGESSPGQQQDETEDQKGQERGEADGHPRTQADFAAWDSERTQLQEEIEQLRQQVQVAKHASAALEDEHKAVVSDQEARIADLNDELTKLHEQMASLSEEKKAVEQQLSDLMTKTEESDEKGPEDGASTNEAHQLTELQHELKQVKEHLETAESAKAELESQLEQTKQALTEANQALTAAQGEIGSFLSQVAQAAGLSLTEETSTKEKLLQALEAAHQNASSSAQEAQNIFKAQIKELQDKLESEEAAWKAKLADIEQDASNMQQQLQDAVTRTATDLATARSTNQQLEIRLEKLKDSLEAEKNSHERTRQQLSEAALGASQSTMLDLELADYQRTVDSLHGRVQDLEAQLGRRAEEVADKQREISSLQTQIKEAEALKTKSETQAGKYKALVLKLKKELDDKREELAKAGKELEEAKLQAGSHGSLVDDLKAQIEELQGSLNAMEANSREADTMHQVEMRELKFQLTTQQRETEEVKEELQRVNLEFQSYKARAHSVLKSDKQRSDADRMKEELADTQEKLTTAQRQLAERAEQLRQAQSSYDELESHLAQVEGELERSREDLANARQQAQQEVSQLKLELVQTQQRHLENEAALKRESQAMEESNKKKLGQVTTSYEQQLVAKEDEIEGLRHKVSMLTDNVEKLQQRQAQDARQTKPSAPAEERAGNFPSTSARLSSSAAAGGDAQSAQAQHAVSSTSGASDLAGLINSPAPSAQGSSDKGDSKELLQAKRQIEHLTALLHDTEANVGRLVEQIKVLKSEIRRYQRIEESSQQSEVQPASTASEAAGKTAGGGVDMVYLKNVIIKFLRSPEARPQLLPVLSMLLDLTPEEQKLATTRSSDIGDEKASGGVISSLSGYISRWS